MFSYQIFNIIIQITCIIIFPIIFLYKIITSKYNSRKIYLVNHACFKPKTSQKITRQKTISMIKPLGPNFSQYTIDTITKMILTSGFGDSTYAPESYLRSPLTFSLEEARREAEAAIFNTVDILLEKTRVKIDEIGILIVNCSIFNPIPSLTSMVLNKYKFRDNVKSFNLTGMGCSAGLGAIDLAHHLLKVHKNTYALIVSTEILTQGLYTGNDPNKHGINCVLRVGGAAILLSNKPSDKQSSKYELIHTVHTNTSSRDSSYNCIQLEEDPLGLKGVNVTKDLLVEANNAIIANLTSLAPLILPVSDKIMFWLSNLIQKFKLGKISPKPNYVPNFGRVIDHFTCHVGGRFVIDAVERTVGLDVEPARMTLHRFGNTSSSSVWYELAYVEAKGKVKLGDRIWQISYGSGFKCNSVIWRAIENVGREEDNPWNEDIHCYPIIEDFETYPLVFASSRVVN
ncbi:hypothetical protein RND81_10G237200 [Saponaria officinalis]|uniref:3-ketoacyl-CoA synthase n=1 Tax=Saponaria officinalis TaxID=3572 RepID=A0AAW1I5S5_SAPOF